jgi:ABC-2 type transport system ATP-binding protein
MTVIEVSGLTKRYGDVTAVEDLSFTADSGTVLGFLGPNGAGKTTTLRMLLGLVTPTAGRATLNGVAFRDLPDPARTVGAVLSTGAFHPRRTGRGHLRLLAAMASLPAARVDEVLDLVGLTAAADRRTSGYSLACSSASAWPRPCSAIPASWSSTNRPTVWTPTVSAGCGASCAT